MANIKVFFIILVVFILISCSSSVPTAQPTSKISLTTTIQVSSTKTPNPTKKPTLEPTHTPTYTPTPWIIIPSYQTKQVILKYTRHGGALGSPDYLFGVLLGYGRETISLVLYSDGQIIIEKYLSPILSKTLSQDEINNLLLQLDKKGFYSVETNQKHDVTDHLYNFGDQYQEGPPGVYSCLSVNSTSSRKVCIYEPYRKFLISPMKELFQFIDDYTPSNMTLYQPDRILLFVSKGQGLYNSFISEPATGALWPSDFPPLETQKEKYIYIEGEKAIKVFSFVNRSFSPRVFSENGQDYSVFITVVFPHESLPQP